MSKIPQSNDGNNPLEALKQGDRWQYRKTETRQSNRQIAVHVEIRSFFVRSTHTTRSPPHDTTSSTHIIIAPFVVLVFGLYVDGKLGQEGALEGKEKARQWDMHGDNFVRW